VLSLGKKSVEKKLDEKGNCLSTLKYRIKEQYGINEQGELFSEN